MKCPFAPPLFILFLLQFTLSQSQEREVIQIKGEEAKIKIESVSIEIQIVGNFATTNTQITFFNPNDRVLEGELNFPLEDGQKVFRFAMDVNGKMREGVIVEKIRGRQAFEGIVRQSIDPGLLEQTEGNNYKARIYPIPANGRKTITVGYQEELKGIFRAQLPFGEVKFFSLKAEVFNTAGAPSSPKSNIGKLTFEQSNNSFVAELTKKKVNLSGALSIILPQRKTGNMYRQAGEELDFFYACLPIEIPEIEKTPPSSIGLIWDVSHSMTGRDLSREWAFIEAYLQYISNVSLHLIVFSNKIHLERHLEIKDGQSQELYEILKELKYDGGTSYGCLNLERRNFDEILLFSDGISNLDKPIVSSAWPPIHFLTSTSSLNTDLARAISQTTGGNFINLAKMGLDDAILKVQREQYRFLGVTGDTNLIHDFFPFPNKSIQLDKLVSLAGRINKEKAATLNMHFGVPGKVMETKEISLSKAAEKVEIARIWATIKLDNLLRDPFHNKEGVVELGKSYGLVTPYTSLIVLDRVQDYVEYKIQPPEELRVEYDSLMASKEQIYERSLKELRLETLNDYQERIDWWEQNHKDSTVFVEDPNDPEENNNQSSPHEEPDREIPVEEQVQETAIPTVTEDNHSLTPDTSDGPGISGKILDSSGKPIQGASIIIKGTRIGIMTDSLGAFNLPMPPRPIDSMAIIVSFIGFSTVELPVDSLSLGEIVLEESILHLDEVVVAGYSVVKSSLQSNASVITITPSPPVAIEGISISQTGQSTLVVRGSTSVQLGADPLYIIDGEAVSSEELAYLTQDEISSINVIKTEEATAIFGSRAAAGVIVITTKYGSDSEEEISLPDSIVTAFVPSFVVEGWDPNRSFIDSFENLPPQEWYDKYLSMKNEFSHMPGFYAVVGNYFHQNDREVLGERVLSNLAELELENHELLKILAWKYKDFDKEETYRYLYERILELRPDEPQSKRDLALSFQAAGKYQEALDLFGELLSSTSDWEDRFPMIRMIILQELNALIARHKDELDLSNVPQEYLTNLPVDIRIVLDWNTLDTDLDLWVTEPNGEKCFFKNELTSLGGRLTEDFMDGYGPEEYIIKNAKKGEYKIEVDFFDDRVQKLSGPVTLQVSIFTHYGSKNQKEVRHTLLLDKESDTIEIGSVNWEY